MKKSCDSFRNELSTIPVAIMATGVSVGRQEIMGYPVPDDGFDPSHDDPGARIKSQVFFDIFSP